MSESLHEKMDALSAKLVAFADRITLEVTGLRHEVADTRQEMATEFVDIRQEMATKKAIADIYQEMGIKQDIAELRQDLSAFRQENRRDHKHLCFILHKEKTERFTELAAGRPG